MIIIIIRFDGVIKITEKAFAGFGVDKLRRVCDTRRPCGEDVDEIKATNLDTREHGVLATF